MAGTGDQVEVLRLIWNEMKALDVRTDGVKAEISAMRADMKAEDDALRRRLTESEIRVAPAVTELSGETRALASLIREWREERC